MDNKTVSVADTCNISKRLSLKIISLLLSIALIIGTIPVAVSVSAMGGSGTSGDPYQITNYQELKDFLAGSYTADTYAQLQTDIQANSSLVSATSIYKSTAVVTGSQKMKILDMNGKKIDLNEQRSIYICGNNSLKITSAKGRGSIVSGTGVQYSYGSYGGAIYNEGNLEVENVDIEGCSASSSGGGISTGYYQAKATLTNVSITNCKTTNDNLAGGIKNSGTITLNNVNIARCIGKGIDNDLYATLNKVNIADCTCNAQGGGIFSKGITTLTDVSITNCKSDSLGGGIATSIYIDTYNKIYNKIYMNRVNVVGCSAGSDAGGIQINYNIEAILNNVNFIDCSASYSGGGIYNDSSACVTLTDVTVTNCTAGYDAAGICNNYSNLTLAGNINVQNNKVSNTGITTDSNIVTRKIITLADNLTGKSGISKSVKDSVKTGNFAKCSSEAVATALSGRFTSDLPIYEVTANTNYLSIDDIHHWTYSIDTNVATGDTIKATCANSGCTVPYTPKVSVSATDATYDGNAHGATLTNLASWTNARLTQPTIYYTSGSNIQVSTTNAPKDAGTYKAMIFSPDNKMASVTYKINKATVTMSDIKVESKVYDGTKKATVTSVTFTDVTNGNKTLEFISGTDYTVNYVTFTSADAGTTGGTFSATLKDSGELSKNYTFVNGATDTKDFSATISKAKVTITNVTAKNKTYDGKTTAEISSIAFDLKGSDKFTEGIDYEISGEFKDKEIGNNKEVTVTVTLSELADSTAKNYEFDVDTRTATTSTLANITAIPVPEPITYTITATTTTGGTIAPSGAVKVEEGKSQSFTATADEGYTLEKFVVDGEDEYIDGNTYTFEKVVKNHTIQAVFAKKDEPTPPTPTPTPTDTGWKKTDDGKWQYLDETSKAVTGWQNNIKGWESQWFYFDNSGIMQTGWYSNIPGWDSKWFYFDRTTGVMQRGWAFVDDGHGDLNHKLWYYLDPTTGAMHTDWEKIDGKWYYLDYTRDNYGGAMQTGWQFLPYSQGQAWFDFASNGAMYENCITPDGYTVDASGVWKQ